MFPKNIIKTPLSFAVVFVLLIFSVPMTSFADDECPCFTAKDVMRFTPPSPFTCFFKAGVEGEDSDFLDARISQRGEYFAYLDAAQTVKLGPDDFSCGAYAVVGHPNKATVVLLGNEDGGWIEIKDLNVDEFDACMDLLYSHDKRIGECDSLPY
jgi:hypothetical protein